MSADEHFYGGNKPRPGTPLKRAPMKRTRIKRSPKKDPMPPDVAEAVLRRAGGHCERCGVRGPVELHHRLPRARGGSHTEENIAVLCSPGGCHDWAHANRTEAIAQGWIVSTSPKDQT